MMSYSWKPETGDRNSEFQFFISSQRPQWFEKTVFKINKAKFKIKTRYKLHCIIPGVWLNSQ
jgi:hypothetical protein